MPRRKARVDGVAVIAPNMDEGELAVRQHRLGDSPVAILTPRSRKLDAGFHAVRVITTPGMRTHPDRVALVAIARGADPEPGPVPPGDTDIDDD